MSNILSIFCLLRSAPALEELEVLVMLNALLQILYAITCFKVMIVSMFPYRHVAMGLKKLMQMMTS